MILFKQKRDKEGGIKKMCYLKTALEQQNLACGG